jgi:hypothetical protein
VIDMATWSLRLADAAVRRGDWATTCRYLGVALNHFVKRGNSAMCARVASLIGEAERRRRRSETTD